MKTVRSRMAGLLPATVVWVAVVAVALSGCSGPSDVERAQAQVTSKEKALKDAQDAAATASDTFCAASKTYIVALDRYGDVINATAPTVGDVRTAGKDLAKPQENAMNGAAEAVAAQEAVVVAQRELAEAQTALAKAKASGSPYPTTTPPPSPTPLVPTASVDRVKQAESEFEDAQSAVTDKTTLTDASEQFNAAVVALEMAWLTLFADTGCLTDDQQKQAQASVAAYTSALQTDLKTAGYYKGEVDGVYGPQTVQAVEDLQKAAGLPVTGTVDKATADALQAKLAALGGAAAQDSVASTAAVQQTLKLAGFWDGPIDGVWSPELTEAVKAFQKELGVEPTGKVDSATVAAFEKALADLKNPPTPAPSPSPSASATP